MQSKVYSAWPVAAEQHGASTFNTGPQPSTCPTQYKLDIEQYLAAGVVPVKLPTPWINLRFLFIGIKLNDMKEVLSALCLLRSSPNLQILEIIAEHAEQSKLSF
ncbi:hypothetical protein QL285_067954 [Trifolium repens]|nr:hypothetical protein QL285_067954 [Trifolium repens]